MTQQTRQQVALAVDAVQSKKGEQLVILEMDRNAGAFTDYFVLCTGTNPRQIQAISDEIEKQLAQDGTRPNSLEGYNQAEWVLLDYVDFVVHIFSERARSFYDLERLWKSARRLTPEDLKKKPAAAKKAASGGGRKTASPRNTARRGAASTRARKKTPTKKKSRRRS
ncbi:MAG TPA: ribosome silencing factor [Candidatus Angelobacter sp.]|nr:ribosome silencing factor [Candidatus Angelobacter sp.]